LHQEGPTISLADNTEDALKSALNSLSGKDRTYQAIDVSKSVSVNAWIQKIIETFGKLDGAVHMAGIIAEPTRLKLQAMLRTVAVKTPCLVSPKDSCQTK
jgi:NAD(P)-dependent dehydrogenase (short-subunit alcohol dehydrogenase family)